jgi:predicted P-loop ATPase
MEETKTKTKKLGDGEHKQTWQEKYATPAEIQRMLDSRVMLRYNEVRGRTEIHWLSHGPVISEDEQGLLTIFGGDEGVTDGYQNLTDRDVNTLWKEMCHEKPVIKQHLQNVIESKYVPLYNPFRYYLDHLPPWTEGQEDAILGLSLTVRVRGDSDEQILFYQYLKKWLVAMVASWVSPQVVNNVMLVLIGPQGSYKTTWFANLLPPQLRDYFYTKTNSGLVSKDDLLTLAQYALVCWEELDTMQPKELNKLKAAMTMPSINERAAYARYHENRPHLASFCGTGNNQQFLSDTTGTRRWLPFEVVSIDSPLASPFDYDGIYAQAYALYRQGFRYWFDKYEIERLQQHNEVFETVHSEMELIDMFFRKPVGSEPRELVSATMALQIVGANIAQSLSKEKIGQAFTKLGFEYKRTATQRGYIAVRRAGVEMEAYRRKLAGSDDPFNDDR